MNVDVARFRLSVCSTGVSQIAVGHKSHRRTRH